MNSESSNNRRRFQRIVFDAGSRIETQAGPVPVKLVDISLNGALIQCPDDCLTSVGDEVSFYVQLDTEHEFVIHMRARVAHIRDKLVGLHCEHIDIDSITFLRRLVELNLGDPELLERELVALG
jgi:hypothetical protein